MEMAGTTATAAARLSKATSGSRKKLPVRSLNAHLVCVLCGGYFVDATAIAECLHSFCRACIVKYFDTNRFCPICDVQVNKTKPLLSLREDTTLQSLVYKLVPSLYQREMMRRKEFHSEHPPSSLEVDGPESKDPPLMPFFFSPDDTISLSLEYQDSEDSESSVNNVSKEKQMVHKRYLQCPAAVSMRHLKKFVRMKYGLGNELQVDIIYDGECLADDFSLMDVAYTFHWQRETPMRFSYRIYERPPPLLPGALLPPTSESVQTESPSPPPPPPPPPPSTAPTRTPRQPTRSTSSTSGDENAQRRQQRRQQRQRSAKTAAYSALEAMDDSATDAEDVNDEDYDVLVDPAPVIKRPRRSVHASKHVGGPGRTPRPSIVDSETRYGRTPGGKLPVYMMPHKQSFQVKNCQVTVVDVQKHAFIAPMPPAPAPTKNFDEYDFETPKSGCVSHLDDEDIEQQAEAMIEEVIEDDDEEDNEAAAAAAAAEQAAAAAAAAAAEAAAAFKRSSSAARKRKKAKHHHHHHHHKHRDKERKRSIPELTTVPTLIPSPDSEMKLTLKLRPCKTPETPQPASPADSTTTPPTPVSTATSRSSPTSSDSPEPVSSSTGKAEPPTAAVVTEKAENSPAPSAPARSPSPAPAKPTEEPSKEKLAQVRTVRPKSVPPTSGTPPASPAAPSPPALPAIKTPASLTVSKISAGEARPTGQTPPPTATGRPSLEILLVPASPPAAEAEAEPDTTAAPEPRADANGALDLSGKSTRTTTPTTCTPTSATAVTQRPVKTSQSAMRNLMTLSDTAVHIQNLMATQEAAICPSPRPVARPLKPPQSASTPPKSTPASIPPPAAVSRPGPNQTVRHIPNPSALLQRHQQHQLLLQAQAFAARDLKERFKLPMPTSVTNNNNHSLKLNGRPSGITTIGRIENMARNNIEKVAAGLTMRAVEARAGK